MLSDVRFDIMMPVQIMCGYPSGVEEGTTAFGVGNIAESLSVRNVSQLLNEKKKNNLSLTGNPLPLV